MVPMRQPPPLERNFSPEEILQKRNYQQNENEKRLCNISNTEANRINLDFVNKSVIKVQKVLTGFIKKGSPPKWVKHFEEIGVKRTLQLGIYGILSTMQEPKEFFDRYECVASTAVGNIASRAQKIYSFQIGTAKDRRKNKLFAWNIIHALVMVGYVELEPISSGLKKVNILVLTEEAEAMLYKGHQTLRDPILTPMLVHPIAHNMGKGGEGGKLTSSLRRTLKRKKKLRGSEELCRALNNLQSTKWLINEHVWEVMTDPSVFGKDIQTWEKKLRHHIANTTIINTLDYAAELVMRKTEYPGDDSHFYHSWEAGPRGRLYTKCPYLSPQGGDLSRGLIKFAEAKPITERGLRWMKIYIAGLFKGVPSPNKLKENYSWSQMKHVNPSINQMIDWFDENEETIIAIGQSPLDFRQLWWEDEESNNMEKNIPFGEKKVYFQRVAATHDYWQALETGFSSIAITLDGTCNGQQHVAAIMRDREHAKYVDLLSGYQQVDFYERIGQEVDIMLKEYADKRRADTVAMFIKFNLDKFTSRNFAKKPVMVLGYGAKKRGVADQIFDQAGIKSLRNRHDGLNSKKRLAQNKWKSEMEKESPDQQLIAEAKEDEKEFGDILASLPKVWHDLDSAGNKISANNKPVIRPGPNSVFSKHHLLAVGKEFKVSDLIAEFYCFAFSKLATSALKVKNALESCVENSETPIQWDTAAGINLTQVSKKQDYVWEKYTDKEGIKRKRKANPQLTATSDWGTKRRKISITRYHDDKYDHDKMKRSISPNFIHSLDASHMILTINEMSDAGISSFQMIHDAFGTHAEDCDEMFEIVKRTFVEIHKDNPFDRLLEKYGVDVPAKGSLKLEEILESEYIIH